MEDSEDTTGRQPNGQAPITPEYFPVRTWNCLKIGKVRTWDAFLKLEEKDVLDIRNAGRRTWSEIKNAQCAYRARLGPIPCDFDDNRSCTDVPVTPIELTRETSLEDDRSDGNAKAYSPGHITPEHFSVRAWNCLKRGDLHTWDALLKLTEKDVRNIRNAGWRTWSEIKAVQCAYRANAIHNPPDSEDTTSIANENTEALAPTRDASLDYGSFESLCRSFVKEALSDEREECIFWRRLNIGRSGKSPTLETLGIEYGVTRERIRQIYRNAVFDLRNWAHNLARFWAAVRANSGEQCIVVDVGVLGQKLKDWFMWDEIPDSQLLGFMLGLHSDMSILDDDAETAVKKRYEGLLLSQVSSVLVQIGREHATEIKGPDLWSIRYDDLVRELQERHGAVLESVQLNAFPAFIIAQAIESLNFSVKRYKDRVYSRDLWEFTYGTKQRVVETILRRSSRALHFTEVSMELKRWRPKTGNTDHAVRGLIDNTNKAIQWGRGFFIHRDNVLLPWAEIKTLECELIEKLSGGIPLTSVYHFYKSHQQVLAACGIPNAPALYSCLRISEHRTLEYPRYPYVLLSGNQRIPIALVIEEYLYQAEGAVTLEELRAYMCRDIGIEERLFGLHMQRLSKAIRTDRGTYTHVDWLTIDSSLLRQLKDYIADTLHTHHHISAQHVIKTNMVTCRRAGIESPEMLYSAIAIDGDERFSCDRYPVFHIRESGAEKSGSGGLRPELLEYLEKMNRPCSYGELEDHFIIQRSYNERAVYAVSRDERVYPYAFGTVVHGAVIGMSPDSIMHIGKCASDEYDKALRNGELYADIYRILESLALPPLRGGVSWTPTLMASILERCRDFALLGPVKRMYVAIPNANNIKCLDDLLAGMIMKEYGRSVPLSVLEKHLHVKHIIRKRLTTSMLRASSNISISYDCVWVKDDWEC